MGNLNYKREKEEVLKSFDDDDQKLLLDMAENNYPDPQGTFLSYASYGLPEKSLLQKSASGRDPEKDLTVEVLNQRVSLKDKNYYIEIDLDRGVFLKKELGPYKDNGKKPDPLSFFDYLYNKGDFSIDREDGNIKFLFSDGDYEIYDSSYKLLEKREKTEGMDILEVLEEENPDVEGLYNHYLSITSSMQEVDSLNP